MTPWVVLGVALAAGVGSQLRHATERAFSRGRPQDAAARFPWSTVTVNLVGSALLGAVAALVQRGDLDPAWGTVLGAGVAGGLTTFSTLSLDVVRLWRERRPGPAIADVVAHVVLGVGAAVGAFHVLA